MTTHPAHGCAYCGALLTDEHPAVRVRRMEVRRSPRHAWRHGTGEPPRFCVTCAGTPPPRLPASEALVRPAGLWGVDPARLELHHCEGCGVPVLLEPDGRRNRNVCSNRCRQGTIRAERAAARQADVKRCAHCGSEMTGRADARFCSTRCRVAAHRATLRAREKITALEESAAGQGLLR